MKKTAIIFLICSLLFLCIPKPIFAHLSGQPPFFKVNGVYSGFYSVPSTSLYNFNLPQDAGPQNYLIGETINFELDKSQLPVPQDIVEKTIFEWDYGDRTKTTGITNSHAYSKMGSYILTIYADTSSFEKGAPPALLQSIMLNIVPNKNYQLPISAILINNKKSKDSLTDWLSFNPNEDLTFDASGSKASSNITEYFWDFGDTKSQTGRIVTHKYDNQTLAFPLLRIKTSDGFIADSFVEVHNDGEKENSSVSSVAKINKGSEEKKNSTNYTPLVIGALVVGTLGILGFLFIKMKKK